MVKFIVVDDVDKDDDGGKGDDGGKDDDDIVLTEGQRACLSSG